MARENGGAPESGGAPGRGAEEFAAGGLAWRAEADDADAVYRNNRAATRGALAAGRCREPRLDDALAARARPENPFFRPRS